MVKRPDCHFELLHSRHNNDHVGSLFHCATESGEKILIKVKRCMNLAQCTGVAVSCQSGGLLETSSSSSNNELGSS